MAEPAHVPCVFFSGMTSSQRSFRSKECHWLGDELAEGGRCLGDLGQKTVRLADGIPWFFHWIGWRDNLEENMVLPVKYRGFPVNCPTHPDDHFRRHHVDPLACTRDLGKRPGECPFFSHLWGGDTWMTMTIGARGRDVCLDFVGGCHDDIWYIWWYDINLYYVYIYIYK